jgi:hypothetical protein
MLSVSATSGEPMDIVVLFDMSRSGSLAYFEQTRDYISGGFLKEFVRKGDTFHLISFGDTPRLELSRRIEGEGDYRTIIGRLLLLYPLAPSGSVENAVAYAEAFVNGLSAERNKKVVFFTAQTGFSPAELGARFTENTRLYLASIPASLGTLVSDRTMAAPVVAAKAPVVPQAAIPAIPVPDMPAQAFPPPAILAPPILAPPERVLPEVSAFPPEPSPLVLMLPDGNYEPVLFDKFKAAMIILPLSLTFLLCALVLAGILTGKKKVYPETYTASVIEDYLYRLHKSTLQEAHTAGESAISSRGLLQKAGKVNGQQV